ncbi:MAG: hypothetical protein HKN49_14210 [Gammaproteobacteria bacterium]|nr:hypothetical protein [Gammaproteobacteria bacterium]
MNRLLALAAILLGGCAATPSLLSGESEPGALAALAAMESRLQYSPVLRIDYSVSASGAVAADLEGDLVLQKPGKAALRSVGDFAGNETSLRMVSDGERLQAQNLDRRVDIETPVAVHEGLLLGLVRMGILHNLAMLTSGAPPDATDGSEPFFAQPINVRWDPIRSTDSHRVLQFDLVVNDQPAGEVALWIATATGMPARREQVVHFDNGDMQVVELYEIELNGIIGPCRFDLAGVQAR